MEYEGVGNNRIIILVESARARVSRQH
jgi:hypothetical protein